MLTEISITEKAISEINTDLSLLKLNQNKT